MTPAEEAVEWYLGTIASFAQTVGVHNPLVDELKKRGRFYTPSFSLPTGVLPGQPQQCFYNAMQLAIQRPTYRYVEGYACYDINQKLKRDDKGPFFHPTFHAWCVNRKGIVIDPTWRDIPEGTVAAYFGVTFDVNDVIREAMREEVVRPMLYRIQES